MKSYSRALAAIALTACAGDRAVAPVAPAPSQAATIVRVGPGPAKTPLIFLDGKEITMTEMESIARDAIRQVEVVKGLKALEVYGARAANGVILIDSKR